MAAALSLSGACAQLVLATLAFAGAAESGELPLVPERNFTFDTDQGTWLSIDVAPDGKTLVFDLLGDLWLLDAGGGAARAITSGMAFDSQPAFSPDGTRVVFLSDRSGAENIWVARSDGSQARQISFRDDHDTFISPEWSADGRAIYVSHHRADLNTFELQKYPVDGSGRGEAVIPVRTSSEAGRDTWRSVLGVAPSRDGRYLYYSVHVGELDYERLPEWAIARREIATGREEILVSAPKSPRPDLSLGSAFRPAISPDGRTLVYGLRRDGRTGLKVMDLETLAERWLAYPVQQDQLMAFSAQDLLPRYAFTPDGSALIVSVDGRLQRLELATREATPIPMQARVSIDVGPSLRQDIRQETGPVRARLIQNPVQSPDGRRLAFSALAHVYVLDLRRGARLRRITAGDTPEFQPAWSPDGTTITYVTWTARDAGHVWAASVDGEDAPRRLTSAPAFYTYPTFAPDGGAVFAVRSSQSVRMHAYMEYGSVRQGELVRLPAQGGEPTVIASGVLGGRPLFTAERDRVYVNFADGLNSVALDGSGRRAVVSVVGPGWYFAEGPAKVDDLKLSPDGKYLLAQIAQQLHVLAMPATTEGVPPKIDLSQPQVPHRRITDVGADFFEWADGGRTITWAVGSTFFRRPLSAVTLDAPERARRAADAPTPGRGGVEAYEAVVEVPRDVPQGAVMLRGATAITMRGDEVIKDSDILVRDGRIEAIGSRGAVRAPRDAAVRDLSGKFIVPGFTDAHAHLADIRRGVVDLESWGARANLAYGVTTAFDPSPLSIDMLAYEDLVDAGLMVGSRIHSTGPALFSFNQFKSLDEVRSVLTRYRTHYRTQNLKQYRSGNRRVRQWIAQAARELGMMPTSEGALSLKLDLTQIVDGFAGTEHALPAVPLGRDVVQLVSRSGVSYTLTLQTTHGGPEAQDYFIAENRPHEDPKLNRFAPHYVLDTKTLQRTWHDPLEYLFPRIAASAAEVVRAGGLLGVGTHGEMPGIGLHWELQAYAMGGMRPHEVLRAGTLQSARTIGRGSEFGSLEPGKYADLVVLDANPLEDIRNTLAIVQVMKNGRLYDGNTLDELWPGQRPLPQPWWTKGEVP